MVPGVLANLRRVPQLDDRLKSKLKIEQLKSKNRLLAILKKFTPSWNVSTESQRNYMIIEFKHWAGYKYMTEDLFIAVTTCRD